MRHPVTLARFDTDLHIVCTERVELAKLTGIDILSVGQRNTGFVESVMRHLAATATTLVVIFGTLTGGWAEEPAAAPQTPTEIAQEHVQTALQFRLDGDTVYSQRLLQLALKTDPNSREAHWHLKLARVGDEWVAVEEVKTNPQRQEVEQKYRQLRAKALGDPKLESSLAKWSQRNGFADRARLHFRRVLANQAATDELTSQAMKKLGLTLINGQLRTADEISQLKATEQAVARALKKGRPQFVAWRDAIENQTRHADSAMSALKAINDVELIPVMESFLEDSGEKFGDQLVQALGRMKNSFAATKSLIQFAVLSPGDAVRQSAAEQLRDRPLHDYVPILIDGLSSPIVSRFYVSRDGRGNVRYQHEVVRREAEGDFVSQLDHTSRHEHVTVQNGGALSGAGADPRARRIVGGQRRIYDPAAEKTEMARLARTAQERERQVEQHNAQVQWANRTVYEALEVATQTNIVRSAPEWRAWWKKYYTETMREQPVHRYYQPSASAYYTVEVLPDASNDYQTPVNIRPVNATARVFGDRPARRGLRSPRSTPSSTSCFAAGTPVWTDKGLVSIEAIKVGDRVLSQDPTTGELAYKLVLVPTVGAPTTGLRRISLHDDAVRLTRSHVVWQHGQGWRMAKELAVSDRLYGIKDELCVTELDEWPTPQQVYNLVVEDFHTYFVGSSGLMVHDITARAPTSAVLPGLIPTNHESEVAAVDSAVR